MSKPGSTQINGRVIRITYQNQENGWTVAKLEAKGRPGHLAVVGKMPGLAEGQMVELKGREILHPKFGPQVEVESYQVKPPSDEQGIERYLASGLIKGVGPKLAQRIVDKLGLDALEIIAGSPEELAKVKGIGHKTAKGISQAVRSQARLREVMVLLQGHGVSASMALRIHRQYGDGAPGVVKNEPHRLAADIHGIGFATADQIAAKLGISHDHPSRLEAGLLYVLRQGLQEGHTCLPYDTLLDNTSQLLRIERGLLGPAYAEMTRRQRIVSEESDGLKMIYLAEWLNLENRVAKAMAAKVGREGILAGARVKGALTWVADKLSVRLSPSQGKAMHTLLTSRACVLTGGPGTGKTTLIRSLITIALRMGLKIALAAPTGRAAKRMYESTGQEALTLHRMLEYSPKDNRFTRDAKRPLDADLVVVDESSMIDIWLMAHLAEAVGSKACLVLVGDADQLPSVGPGLVLRQLISCGRIPVARLTEIFRQDSAGLIVKNAHRILHGSMPVLPRGEPNPGADFFMIPEENPELACAKLVDLISTNLPKSFNLDPMNQIQVLSPMRRGWLGCNRLNQELQNRLNPNPKAGEGRIGPGDKVMQIRNNYDLDVFNGDLGLVSSLDRDGGGCVVAMGERLVSYNQQEMEDLTLAYAVTIHKSQGSEYPAVVVALGQEHFIMLNQPLLYTAVTRGKSLVVIVGHPSALAKAVKTADPNRRHALLDKKLIKLIEHETVLLK